MFTKVLRAACMGLGFAYLNTAAAAPTVDPDWSLSPFQTETVEMAVATDKAGHKMHVMRTKDGAIMAVTPAQPFWALMRPWSQ